MKIKLITVLMLLSVLKGFSQTASPAPQLPTVDSKEYRDLKMAGLLQSGVAYPSKQPSVLVDGVDLQLGSYDLSKPNTTPQNNTNRQPVNGHTNKIPGGACRCLQSLDASYSVVPFVGYTGPDYRNDDGSSPAIPLPFTFCLYGVNYNSIYINCNGNLTFGAPYSPWTSVGFPTTAASMIAAFWADIDILAPASGLVHYKVNPTNMIVQWDQVGYFPSMADKLNTFQIIITDGSDPILPPGKNVAFCFGDMQWTTGSASGGTGGFGGTPANVGINGGLGTTDFIQIGRFNQPGATYLGAYGGNSGVDWLDYQSIYFDACSNTNVPPVPSGVTPCDTIKVCSLNDTVLLNMQFLSPEAGQTTSITYNLGGVTGFSCTSNVPGNTAAATFQFVGSPLNYGLNSITITGTDNGAPVGVSTVILYVLVDTSLASTLNPIVSGTLSFCTGDSTLLSVNPTTYDAYLWSNGPTTVTDWIFAPGTYSVTSWFNGCQKTKTVNVTENPLPTPAIVGNSITACGTGTTTLSSDSLIYTTYAWSNGSATSSIVVGAGTYTLTVTDANGCTFATAPFNVTSAPPPTIQAHNDTLFCNGGMANLWVDFTGPTIPPVCQLSTTGGCASTSTSTIGTGVASNSSFSYPAPFGNFYTSMVTQFLYTAAELNAAGITGGKIDQLDWNVIANIGISTYHNFTVKMGCTNITQLTSGVYETGLFTVYPPSTYNVTMGWNAIPFATSFEWDGVSNIIVEVCFAEFTAPCLSNWTDNAQTNYTATAYTSSQWWLSDCNDQCSSPTGFNNTALMHPDMQLHWCSLAHNPSDYAYLWTAFPGSGGIANDTLQTTTASPTAPTTLYQVSVVAHAGGCSALDTVVVNQVNLATMHITPAGPYCLASPIDTLQASVPIGTGVYSITPASPGLTDTILGIFNPALAGLGTFTIHYTVSSSFCGSADTSIVVTVANALDPTITNPGHVCNSWNAFNLTAASPGGVWTGTGIVDSLNGSFSPNLAGVGPHTITYTIYAPCYSQDTTIITVDQQLFAAIDTVQPICINAPPIILHSIGSGGIWSGTGITGPATGTFNPATAGPGPHIITHYFNQLCGDTATTTIIVVPLPVITAIAPDSGCAPLTVPFQSTTDQSGGTFFWDFGDGHTSNLQNPTELYTSFNGGVPYTVTFTYTDTVGCASTIVHPGMVHVFSQPVAIFSATPQPTDITSPAIQFIDHSTGVVNTWIWTFGTGAGSSLQNPNYTYADTGHFVVQLVVINDNGCTDTTQGMIVIDPITTCYIPSAFSPNGNGDNEVFKVYASDILKDDFTLSIYNRWGEKLFESNDYNIGWNGAKNNSGEVVELGVYVYKVHLRDWKGLGHDYIGHVTLLK